MKCEWKNVPILAAKAFILVALIKGHNLLGTSSAKLERKMNDSIVQIDRYTYACSLSKHPKKMTCAKMGFNTSTKNKRLRRFAVEFWIPYTRARFRHMCIYTGRVYLILSTIIFWIRRLVFIKFIIFVAVVVSLWSFSSKHIAGFFIQIKESVHWMWSWVASESCYMLAHFPINSINSFLNIIQLFTNQKDINGNRLSAPYKFIE